jgi:hypothetical protein
VRHVYCLFCLKRKQVKGAESEADFEKGKNQELMKEIKRLEKRLKDVIGQLEDERIKVISLNDSNEKLQEKMKKYRGQIEGAVRKKNLCLLTCSPIGVPLSNIELALSFPGYEKVLNQVTKL